MKKILLFAIFVFFGLMLIGCTQSNTTVVNTNQLYQTNYE